VLYSPIEDHFCLNGSIKNLSVSQKVICGERQIIKKVRNSSDYSSDYKKVRKRWFFKEPLTE